MTDNIIFRPAQKKDISGIQTVMGQETQILSSGQVWSKKDILDYFPHNMVLVAEHDNRVVGFVIAEKLVGNGALIQLRVVDKKYRGHGIGTELSDYTEQVMRDLGIEWFLSYAVPQVAAFHKKRGASSSGKPYTEIFKVF